MKREDLIVYLIYVKSFKDSNNDGIGDLRGIINKLPYLFELGINYIWLSPIYQSPEYDNGYDVSDYYEININYGTMDDFDNLIREAEKYNIKIMMDMVFNHTSDQHLWFKKALAGEKYYQDFYYFEKAKFSMVPPTNWVSKFGYSSWEYVDSLNKWYLHLFLKQQPDLNWTNKAVRKELQNVVNFWLDKGVKGLRFDVINLISKPAEKWENDFKSDGKSEYTDGEKVSFYLKELHRKTFGKYQDVFTVGELSSTTIHKAIEYSDPLNKELDMVFTFHHLKTDYINGEKWTDAKPNIKELKEIIIKQQLSLQAQNAWSGNFFSNHDQPRQLSRFGDPLNYRFQSATAIALTYILFRGTPFLFFGEEIGMTNIEKNNINDFDDQESINNYHLLLQKGLNKDKVLKIINQKSRESSRIPFSWNNQEYFGFSEHKPWIKTINNSSISLKNDVKDKNSIFNFYKKLLKIRKDSKTLRTGIISFLDLGEEIFSYFRADDQEIYLILSNWSNKKIKLNKTAQKGTIILNNYDQFDFKSLLPYQAVLIKLK